MMRSYSGGKTVRSSGKSAGLTTENASNLANFLESAINAWTDDGQPFAVPDGMTVDGVHYGHL